MTLLKSQATVGDCCVDEECACGGVDMALLPPNKGQKMGCKNGRVKNIPGKLELSECPRLENASCGKAKKKGGCCNAIENYLEHLGKGTTWLSIIFGQVLSLLLVLSGVTSVYLADIYRIRIPNAQNFAFYIVLATVLTSILACRPAERNLFPILRTRGWKYAFVALADAEANYLVTKAYQLTTLTSVQLLDCFTIPTVLSLSWLVLRIRYKVPHILGVFICLLGVCCLVWADIEDGRPLGPGKNRFMGDMLCLCGAFLHGISNVAQEFVVKTFDVVEFLAMIGLFGSFISGAQTLLLEYGAVTSAEWTPSSVPTLLFIAHGIAQLLFFVISAFVVKWSGATALNLSLLTADFYSLIVGVFLFRMKVDWLYFLSFLLVMTGVMVFSIKPTILDSHVYQSLKREHTTSLDLELMASTPCQTGHCNCQEVDEEMMCVCEEGVDAGGGSILRRNVVKEQKPMLSTQGCDVVLQATSGIGGAQSCDR